MPQTPDSRPAIAAAVIIKDKRVLLIRRRVREGTLSWQFPAGELEVGESAEDAAIRETAEEVGLTVKATDMLGKRVHPATRRTMFYVACDIVDGSALVTDDEEVAELAWCQHEELTEYVPTGFFPPVQDYLNRTLA